MKTFTIEIKDDTGSLQLQVQADSFHDALKVGYEKPRDDWEPYAWGSSEVWEHSILSVKGETFETHLTRLINCHSLENGSDTPDFILAQHLKGCLDLYNATVSARDKLHNREPEPCSPSESKADKKFIIEEPRWIEPNEDCMGNPTRGYFRAFSAGPFTAPCGTGKTPEEAVQNAKKNVIDAGGVLS